MGQMAQGPANRCKGKGQKAGGADGHKEPCLTTGGPRKPFAVVVVRKEVVNLNTLPLLPACHPRPTYTYTGWCRPDHAVTYSLLRTTSPLRGDKRKPQWPGAFGFQHPCQSSVCRRALFKPLKKVHYPRFPLRAMLLPLLCQQMPVLIRLLSIVD